MVFPENFGRDFSGGPRGWDFQDAKPVNQFDKIPPADFLSSNLLWDFQADPIGC